jgi:hypothetical protein
VPSPPKTPPLKSVSITRQSRSISTLPKHVGVIALVSAAKIDYSGATIGRTLEADFRNRHRARIRPVAFGVPDAEEVRITTIE